MIYLTSYLHGKQLRGVSAGELGRLPGSRCRLWFPHLLGILGQTFLATNLQVFRACKGVQGSLANNDQQMRQIAHPDSAPWCHTQNL